MQFSKNSICYKETSSPYLQRYEMRLWFTLRDFETLEKREYVPSKVCTANRKKNIHRGQWKLLISEIQFLTSELSSLSQTALCVYVGACSGKGESHLPFLMQMFPATKWLLCDPLFDEYNLEPFEPLIEKGRVSIYTGSCTEETARAMNDYMLHNVQNEMSSLLDQIRARECELTLFISDLRSENADELTILNDMQLQYNIFHTLSHANSAILKFRPPYPDTSQSIIHPMFRDNVLTYPTGKIYWSVFGGVQTTETRIHIKQHSKMGYYDCSVYEQILYAFNMLERPTYDNMAQEATIQMYLCKFVQRPPKHSLQPATPTLKRKVNSPNNM